MPELEDKVNALKVGPDDVVIILAKGEFFRDAADAVAKMDRLHGRVIVLDAAAFDIAVVTREQAATFDSA